MGNPAPPKTPHHLLLNMSSGKKGKGGSGKPTRECCQKWKGRGRATTTTQKKVQLSTQGMMLWNHPQKDGVGEKRCDINQLTGREEGRGEGDPGHGGTWVPPRKKLTKALQGGEWMQHSSHEIWGCLCALFLSHYLCTAIHFWTMPEGEGENTPLPPIPLRRGRGRTKQNSGNSEAVPSNRV